MEYLEKNLEEGNFIEIGYITSNGDIANGVSQFTFAGRITYNRNSIEYTCYFWNFSTNYRISCIWWRKY